MRAISRKSTVPFLLAVLAVPAWGGLSAQQGTDPITVVGSAPTDLTGLVEGPEIEGVISARRGEAIQVTGDDGASTAILVSPATDIKASGGFLGLDRTALGTDSLLNGLPVTVQTVQWEGGLVASKVRFKNGNFQTASMIRTGTEQRFGEHDTAIAENAAALRSPPSSSRPIPRNCSTIPMSTSWWS